MRQFFSGRQHLLESSAFQLDPPYKPEISAQLLSLNLSHNKLHTFHLATTLPSLNLLDLSANHLTSFASLDQLPALEHLHLARNTGIRLVGPTEPNTVLGQVDLANCSLEELPDMHRFYALKELQAAGNRLREVPSHLLPSKVSFVSPSSPLFRRASHRWIFAAIPCNTLAGIGPPHSWPDLSNSGWKQTHWTVRAQCLSEWRHG